MSTTKNVVAKPKLTTIGKTKAADIILNSNGKFLTAVFATKENPTRKMTFRLSVTKHLSTNPAKKTRKVASVAPIGMVTVYDMLEKGYRTVNLQTLSYLKAGGVEYKVRK